MLTTNPDSTDAFILQHNKQAAQMWSSGGEAYDRISQQIADAIEHCVDRLDPQPGEKILDVATGTGWTARRIQARGADVTGVDLGEEVIRAARRLDRSEVIEYLVADAEVLPFSDGEFDAVISTFGVMFCSAPKHAADELARVCKPGGRLALATWDNHGGVHEMFQVIARHKPAQPAAAASPFDWSDSEQLETWFGNNFDIVVERATSFYREHAAGDAWQAFAEGYGPVKSLIDKLNDDQTDAFRKDFIEFHEQHHTGAGVLVPRPYVITVGNRLAD